MTDREALVGPPWAQQMAADHGRNRNTLQTMIIVPDGLSLMRFQEEGVAGILRVWATGHGCLLADEMGLGKTVQALAAINAAPEIRNVLVVCPASVKLQWADEARRWLTRPLSVAVQESGTPWKTANVCICNYDLLKTFMPQIRNFEWDLRIADEAHYVKNPKAQRSKLLLSIPASKKLALTGTPILNRPVEIFTNLQDLNPGAWPKKSYWSFVTRYCDAKQTRFGWDMSGHSNCEELCEHLYQTIMVRRMKADVLPQLPPKRRRVIELDGNRAGIAQAELDAMGGRSYEEFAESEVESPDFASISKLRHAVALAKISGCIDYIRDAVEVEKVVVFAHHLDVVSLLRSCSRSHAVITGQSSDDERHEAVERFQNDPHCRLFIGTSAAAEGITLTASSHVVFVEGDWTPAKILQKEDRCHRIGQDSAVLVTHLVLAGSLDAYMAKTIVRKQDVLDRCLTEHYAK